MSRHGFLVRVSGGINAGDGSLHVAVCIEIFKPDVFDSEPVITRRSAGCVYYNIRFGRLFFSARIGIFNAPSVRQNGPARSENIYPALFETAPQKCAYVFVHSRGKSLRLLDYRHSASERVQIFRRFKPRCPAAYNRGASRYCVKIIYIAHIRDIRAGNFKLLWS